MASEELENSLRDEVDSFVRTRLDQMQEQISRLQDEVNAAFMRLRDQHSVESSMGPSFAEKISEHLRSARESGMQDAVSASQSAKAASGIAVLKAAIEDIDDQRTQADILNMLVNRAGSFAPRVAFFVVKNEQIIGWRARGLEGSVGDDAIREVSLPLTSETSIGEAVRSHATFSGDADSHSGNYAFLEKVGGDLPRRLVAIPLVVRGKSVAVLYSDSAGLEPDAINVEALETLVRVASMAVALLAVSRMAPASAPQPAQAETAPAPPQPQEVEPSAEYAEGATHDAAAPSAEIAEAQPQPQAYAVESPAGDYQAPAEPADVRSEPAPQPEPFVAQQPAVEPETAQAGGSRVAPLGTTRRYGSSAEDLPVDVSDDEKRLHNDARRFARLLVSEIKLYNEQKVREGRVQSNIYERLREDIDRSREMYDKRVAPPVAARYDYFHQELVNTLAEGDPGKLGNEYPGAQA